MALSPFFKLQDSFPAVDHNEAGELLSRLVASVPFTNIWELAGASTADLGSELSKFTSSHFDAFWNSLKTQYTDVIGSFSPADPAKLTDEEVLVAAKMAVDLYGRYPSGKIGALQLAVKLNGKPDDNIWQRLAVIQTATATTARTKMTPEFFDALASYYIAMAGQYIQNNSREFRFLGRVLNDSDGLPKAGVRVACTDGSISSYPRQFGTTTTNPDGYFRIAFTTLDDITAKYPLTFTFTHRELANAVYSSKEYDPDTPRIAVEFALVFNAIPSTSKTVTSTGIGIPADVQAYLTANSITVSKLEDIRRIGTFKNLPSDTIDKNNVNLLKLDGLASLEVVNADNAQNASLYDRGYTGISRIANTPGPSFVEDNRDLLGDYGAGKVHYVAQAAHLYGLNNLASELTAIPGRIGEGESLIGPATGCGCSDCASTVSPLAYLADLLSFTVNNLNSSNGTQLTSVYLKDNFFQEFGQLPASCSQLKGNICQNRISTEVMRKYYNTVESGIPSLRKDAFDTAEKEYLMATYEYLLTKLGTSYSEVRRMRAVPLGDLEERMKVSDRLGVVLDDGTDTIAQLFIDLSDPLNITESGLESLFGLRDSSRSVLTTTPESKVEQWKKARLREIWETQDSLTNSFWDNTDPKRSVIIDPDVVTIDDLRYPSPTSSNHAWVIWKNRRAWLDDRIHALRVLPTLGDKLGAMVNAILYTATTNVDSEVKWFLQGTGASAFLLNLRGRKAAVLAADEGEIADLWNDFRLRVPEYLRLLELMDADDPETGDELVDILVQSSKNFVMQGWLAEELHATNSIQLGPKDFFPSQREPKVGPWPPSEPGVPLIDPDLLDTGALPEITAQSNFPITWGPVSEPGKAPMPGATSLSPTEIHTQRKEYLADNREAIRAANEAETTAAFTAMLDIPFGTLPYTWDPAATTDSYRDLLAQLSDPVTSESAIAEINDTLKLSVEDFKLLVDIGLKQVNVEVVSDGLKERLYLALAQSYKLILVYPSWLAQEASLTGASWKLRKALLPKWRATPEQRRTWITALAENSERPIIDPDLIGPGDLADPQAGDAAFDLWKLRYEHMHTGGGWLDQINASFGNALSNTTDFKNLTQHFLNINNVEGDLAVIQVQQEAGTDIRPRLLQLNLTSKEFDQLMACRDILAAGQNLKEEEKTSVKQILAQVQKRREYFTWRLEEMADGITLSGDYFRIAENPIGEFPPQPEYPLNPWLATARDLIDWRRTLKGRIAQEKSVLDALQEMLFEVDEAMVVKLRDALVSVCGNPAMRLVENARSLGNKLLIDLENNCCYKTNRVAAAIETLQQLLWKTSTGDILHDYPEMSYIGGDFDEAWTWMGSYANWRAAMFVFLYPENVLIPSLRKEQTPAFRDVIQATRGNRRFSPADACKVGRDYRDYLSDVADLEVKCAAEAEAFVQEKGCGTLTTVFRQYNFVFAQGRTSHRPYFSRVDANTPTDIKQENFWEPIPNLTDQTRIAGCSVFYPQDIEKFIYLFYTIEGLENKDKFYALRFDLNNGRWEEEPLEFQVEQDALCISSDAPSGEYVEFKKEQFSTEIQAIAVRHIDRHDVQPTIAVSLKKTEGVSQDLYTFYWPMHENGKEFKPRWNGDGWRLSINGSKVLRGSVRSFQGITVDENNWKIDHSVFVLRRTYSAAANPAWSLWLTRLNYLLELKNFFAAYSFIFEYIDTPSGERIYGNAIQGMIDDMYDNEPDIYLLTNLPITDCIIYVQIFGEPSRADTLYYLPEFTIADNIEVKSLVQFYDDQTLHVEFIRGGNPSQCAITYSDPGQIIAGSETATGFEANTRLIAPIRPDYFLDQNGGLIIHQVDSPNRPIVISYFAKQYDAGDPVESMLLVNSDGLRLTPDLLSVPVIHDEYTAAELGVRRLESSSALINNLDPNFRLAEYVWEGYYFVPLQIGLQLSTNGHYQDALDWFATIYDIRRDGADRKIWYGLTAEETGTLSAERAENWFSDPLNPHAIAATRPYTYTRYTILAIAQCLLNYADSQFTIDTSESVPRARELYEDAIALLQLLVPPDPCPQEQAVHDWMTTYQFDSWWSTFQGAFDEYEEVVGLLGSNDLAGDISDVLSGTDPLDVKYASVRQLIETAGQGYTPRTFDEVLEQGEVELNGYTAAALGNAMTDKVLTTLATRSDTAYKQVMERVTGEKEADLIGTNIVWLRDTDATLGTSREEETDPIDPARKDYAVEYSVSHPAMSFQINSPFPNLGFSGLNFTFCTVPNPIVKALLMTGEVQLWKIHNCMNIAGMVRELDPFAAPTDSTTGIPVIGVGGSFTLPTDTQLLPSAYRYRIIVDRARQLVGMAQQVESAFLATLEKLDAERYSIMRADQDIESNKANVKLQDLKVKEATDGVTLAEYQKERSQIQFDHFDDLLDRGNSALEIASFAALSSSVAVQYASSITYGVAAASKSASIVSALDAFTDAAQALSTVAGALASTSQLLQLFASFERRKEDWTFQRSLAQQDLKIGEQGIKIAKDRVQINGQERVIAALQGDHAKVTLDFLKNKFTSAELYEWMSGVLQDVYAYFLQEATAMALLAQRQLSFERQLDLPPFIRTDYWVVDPNQLGGTSITGETTPDRRGLTGSVRLLKDLTELDQYAFSTNSPKLQMSKTLSLNEIAPEELMQLRDKGIMSFRTTQDLFDRDYPGQYLRLIKKVSVTVIALNPPTKGIRATLTNGGVSRVITGGTIFQERVINRYPEQIALSGGVSDYGVFQLRGEGEFLDPFEGTGVDTQWEFRMEKAANPFDYDSIADVLLTIEYEALNSFTYRNTVVQRLNNEDLSANLAISFKNNLPDQWFDLNNPDNTSTPFTVQFDVNARDMAPNINAPRSIEHVSLYFVMKDGEAFDQVVTLGYNNTPRYEATPNENLISTRLNAQGFVSLQGVAGPEGTWTFGLANTTRTRTLLADDLVEDILLVVTYGGSITPYSK